MPWWLMLNNYAELICDNNSAIWQTAQLKLCNIAIKIIAVGCNECSKKNVYSAWSEAVYCHAMKNQQKNNFPNFNDNQSVKPITATFPI